MRYLALFLLLLGGCRYTFWPLIPEEAAAPPATLVEARLAEEEDAVKIQLRVRRLARPGYLELVWYRDERVLARRSLFVEKAPFTAELRLPKPGAGLYRLELRFEDRLVYAAALEVGPPTAPPAPAPPAP